MKNEKFKIKIDGVKKIIKIAFTGMLESEDCEKFFNIYSIITRGVSKKNYSIVVNCRKMEVFKPEILPYMMQEYMEYNQYKHIHIIESAKAVTNMQLKRIGRKASILDKTSFIKDERRLMIA